MSAPRTIRSILIANRGEIALRVIRTCQELGIRSIAVYSEADRVAPHVLAADAAFPIGPSPSRESYLVIDRILSAAVKAGADAIHPGYGFLAENPEFAERVTAAGLIFIGPSASSIRAMGDKTAARALVRKAGVPTVPGTDGPVDTVDEARVFGDHHGYPVLIKAAAGGGGKGMRVVSREQDLSAAFAQAQSEAGSAFGDPRVYLERYLEEPRHVEFQILADTRGTTVHLGERECSIQRRHQKIIEESPSVVLDESLRSAMGGIAVRAAEACGYTNAGTVEFLLDREKRFYFLEMNTRLQVEHPVTELRTGLDLVAEQIRVAEGHPLAFRQQDIRWSGHAIECRICAEDPWNSFLPATGNITRLRPAGGPGIREDRGVEQGGEIPVFYDSMISKLVAWAPDRDRAIRRMVRALREYELIGVPTNIPVCLFVLEHESFRKGEFSTAFLGRYYRPEHLSLLDGDPARFALAAASTCSRARLEKTAPQSVGRPEGSTSGRWKDKRTDTFR